MGEFWCFADLDNSPLEEKDPERILQPTSPPATDCLLKEDLGRERVCYSQYKHVTIISYSISCPPRSYTLVHCQETTVRLHSLAGVGSQVGNGLLLSWQHQQEWEWQCETVQKDHAALVATVGKGNQKFTCSWIESPGRRSYRSQHLRTSTFTYSQCAFW